MASGGFLRREVLPYAPDAWYVRRAVKIGYEISFNRYFYKPEPMRTLEEIRADILAVERETDGFAAEYPEPSRRRAVREQPKVYLARAGGNRREDEDVALAE